MATEKKFSASRDGIEIFNGVTNDMVEMAMCDMYMEHFNMQKANIDNSQRDLQKNSPFSELSDSDKKKCGVKSIMPTWLWLEIMNGTNDEHFWTDESNREKFLKENPQYLVKNFRT